MEYLNNKCPVCNEDLNMYGGCKCNDYTYAGNKEYIIGIDLAVEGSGGQIEGYQGKDGKWYITKITKGL